MSPDIVMFDKELAYFIAHQDELVKAHRGQVLVIRGEHVEGAYPNALTAYLEAQKRFQLGTFMLQPCQAGPEAFTSSIFTPDL